MPHPTPLIRSISTSPSSSLSNTPHQDTLRRSTNPDTTATTHNIDTEGAVYSLLAALILVTIVAVGICCRKVMGKKGGEEGMLVFGILCLGRGEGLC